GALLRLAGIRIDFQKQWPRQVKRQPIVALELRLQLAHEGAFGVEAGDLVLILVGEQLEVIARYRFGQPSFARHALLLRLLHPTYERFVTPGVAAALVALQEVDPPR